jgi:hypothetical protein
MKPGINSRKGLRDALPARGHALAAAAAQGGGHEATTLTGGPTTCPARAAASANELARLQRRPDRLRHSGTWASTNRAIHSS